MRVHGRCRQKCRAKVRENRSSVACHGRLSLQQKGKRTECEASPRHLKSYGLYPDGLTYRGTQTAPPPPPPSKDVLGVGGGGGAGTHKFVY